MANQVTGRVWVRVNGKTLRSKEGAKLQYGGKKREAVVSGTDVVGYAEAPETPGVDCTLIHMADTSLAEILDITDATMQYETDTEITYILRHAWCVGALELTGGKGEIAAKFQALTCEEA